MSLHRTFILRNDGFAQALYAFLKQNWKAMADTGKPLAVSVSEYKSKRSIEQNARLHALLSEIAEQAWVRGRQYDAEIWKEYFRSKFIGTEEIEMPDGKRFERGISTTTLDVAAFSDFMERIQEHATRELGVVFSQ
jgi:hypothetical protein